VLLILKPHIFNIKLPKDVKLKKKKK